MKWSAGKAFDSFGIDAGAGFNAIRRKIPFFGTGCQTDAMSGGGPGESLNDFLLLFWGRAEEPPNAFG